MQNSKILITGMAGSGKTTIINELLKRDYTAFDLDAIGVCSWVNKNTGKDAAYSHNADSEWFEEHSWRCDLNKLKGFLASFNTVFVGGKIATSQITEIGELFDKIFLLSPNDSVLRKRLSTRDTNDFAKSKNHQEEIIKARKKFEEAIMNAGGYKISNHNSVDEAVEKIIKIGI